MPQFVHAPEKPQWFCCVPSWHCPFEQQNPLPHVPSLAAPQAEVQKPAEQVGVRSTHVAHMPPLAPQAPLARPPTHCEPLQQPPLQLVCPAPHAVSHSCV